MRTNPDRSAKEVERLANACGKTLVEVPRATHSAVFGVASACGVPRA